VLSNDAPKLGRSTRERRVLARWGRGKNARGIKTFFLNCRYPDHPAGRSAFNGLDIARSQPVFSVPLAPRIVSVFFVFLLRGLAVCLNKHRAIDVAVIIAAEGTASHPLRCSTSLRFPPPLLFSVFSIRARVAQVCARACVRRRVVCILRALFFFGIGPAPRMCCSFFEAAQRAVSKKLSQPNSFRMTRKRTGAGGVGRSRVASARKAGEVFRFLETSRDVVCSSARA